MKYVKNVLLILIVWMLATGPAMAQIPPAPEPESPAPVPGTVQPDLPDAEAVATAEGTPQEELVYLNVQDAEIRDVVKQISRATQRNFIIDDKVRGKVTILSEKPMTRDEAYQTFLSALEVAGFTVVAGPSGVYKIVALRDAVREPIPTHVDTTPITSSYITRLISLTNISALEMANAIKGLVSKDGNLFAYPSTNTLIITDSGINIDRLMKIIKELDQEGPQEVMEIIPIQYASARDVAQVLSSIFSENGQNKTARRPAKGAQEGEDSISKVIADERTNSVIVMASKRSIESVKSIIRRLDAKVSDGREGRIHVYYLKHAKAKEMADTLASVTAGGAKSAAKSGGKGTDIAVAEFEGGLKIAPDEPTNSLIITATSQDFQTLIDKVISKLDVPRRQVYLEASIMELTLRKGRELGFAAHGGGPAGLGLGFGQTFGAASPTSASGLLQGFSSAVPFLGGLISRDTVEVNMVGANNELQTVSVPAFSAFLTALASYGEANIISSPNILTLDNQEAVMEVLTSEPIPGQQTITSANIGQSTPVTYEDAGLKLKITPQIGDGETVRLVINQELSNFGTINPELKAPTKVSRKISTTVVTRDGQTVVLGGLMEDKNESTKQKVPVLGDIPLLGFFFRQTTTSVKKSNLLVFITPHVLNNTTDFETITKRKIEERNKFIDMNYGRKQSKQIRESITNHREDLLEFKSASEGASEPVSSPSTSGWTQEKMVTPAPSDVIPPAQDVAPTSPTATRPPVITAPPPQGITPQVMASPPAPPAPSVKAGGSPVPNWVLPSNGGPTPGARQDRIDLNY